MCRDRWFENVDGRGNFDALANEIPILESDATRADYDGDGDLDVYGNGWWLENRRVGDANNNGAFDSEDLTAVLASGKYDSGEAATFDEGDWNQDGRFDSKDLVYAFQIGGYRP
jgi:hypothetical protein